MREIIQDVDRPDVNGVPPRMQALHVKFAEAMKGTLPFFNSYTNDNIMSSISFSGSFEPKEQWHNGIFENSKGFKGLIRPVDGKRYYDPADPKVRIEIIVCSKTTKFRKYTGPFDKCLAQLQKWIEANKGV